jgi:hypothetical protein
MVRLLGYLGVSLLASGLLGLAQQQMGEPSPSSTVQADTETVRRLTPSAPGLRKRFKRVDSDSGSLLTDIFDMGPNLGITVAYGSDHLACNIKIESTTLLTDAKMTSVIDDLAPPP